MSFSKEELELIYHSRPHAFRVVGEPYSVSRQSAYVAEMVRQQKEKYKDREKFPVTKIQAASTQAILDRDPALDKIHFNRPNPTNWKAVPDADFSTPEGVSKGVGERLLSEEERSHVEATRRRPKNGIEYDDRSATTAENREKAVDAFCLVPGKAFRELNERQRAVIKCLAKGGVYKTTLSEQEQEQTKRDFTQILKSSGMAAEYGYAPIRIPIEVEVKK